MFVKPARGGSSIGISKVHGRDELDAAVEEARRHDPKVLVEVSAEGGREVECGVLQGFGANPPDASVVAEISVDGAHEFYDFAAKYLPEESTGLTVPADLPEHVVTADPGAVGAGVRGARRARGWPGWTSSCCPTSGW